ncbi:MULTISPECIES: ATP-dependent nuclease [unclassified Pseudoalteromonas]|uniref:ATP-dependent nuclease n=1 Tax=unclassified Pseudoalteromonas TaxID=194690 RepID=UPI00041B8DD7|nr:MULTISPECIES: TOPRIM nucleotidyl transferase/hydrolase domain-containing protein [unclassified Pseudoalteromonas]
MKIIERIKLFNFKKFLNFEVQFTEEVNLLIGDNEAGKSSILSAIELVLSGSKSKIETIGIDNLFNKKVINDFLVSDKSIENLPTLRIELYLNDQDNPHLNGKVNSEGVACDGLVLTCEPNEELTHEISEVLAQAESNFPFEYYVVNFATFSGQAYSGYRKFLKHLTLDSSQINNDYATKEYIKSVYDNFVEQTERIKLKNEYRQQKVAFTETNLKTINDKLDEYQFSLRTGSKSNLETDLNIVEDDVPIENKGKGRQCFIKTEFALKEHDAGKPIDVLLLEEPENHLSHTNMKKLVHRISESHARQIFIATHNSLISTRLNLRNAILLNSSSAEPLTMKGLPEDTAKFFMKAPDNNVLEFILSAKVILVEGDAEYILLDSLYSSVSGSTLEANNIHVISVGGTSFKRYLDIAKILGIRTAVIRDNDGDYQANCVDGYVDYRADNIGIFYDDDNTNNTFEVCLYSLNQDVCDELWLAGRRALSVQEFMLKNKADCAFELLDKKADHIETPDYIKRAFQWINE